METKWWKPTTEKIIWACAGAAALVILARVPGVGHLLRFLLGL